MNNKTIEEVEDYIYPGQMLKMTKGHTQEITRRPR